MESDFAYKGKIISTSVFKSMHFRSSWEDETENWLIILNY